MEGRGGEGRDLMKEGERPYEGRGWEEWVREEKLRGQAGEPG